MKTHKPQFAKNRLQRWVNRKVPLLVQKHDEAAKMRWSRPNYEQSNSFAQNVFVSGSGRNFSWMRSFGSPNIPHFSSLWCFLRFHHGAGEYQDEVHSIVCKRCGFGFYQDPVTAAWPLGVLVPNSYQDLEGQIACKACPASTNTLGLGGAGGGGLVTSVENPRLSWRRWLRLPCKLY